MIAVKLSLLDQCRHFIYKRYQTFYHGKIDIDTIFIHSMLLFQISYTTDKIHLIDLWQNFPPFLFNFVYEYSSCYFPVTAHNDASFSTNCGKYKRGHRINHHIGFERRNNFLLIILWDWGITCSCVLGTCENFSVELNI